MRKENRPVERLMEQVMEDLPGLLDGEAQAIILTALAERLRTLKVSYADAVIEARDCSRMDNLGGANAALRRAKELKKRYMAAFADWKHLGGDDVAAAARPANPDEEESPDDDNAET